MRQAVGVVGVVNVGLFIAVALVAVREWRRNPGERTGFWAALAFVSLAWVIVAGMVLPEEPAHFAGKAIQRVDLAVFLLFPYFVYRFAVAFEPTSRPLARFVDTLSVTLVIATFALPYLPAEGESWPWWFTLYAVAFLVHWSVLLSVVAWRLWRASRQEATVARRRMQLLAFAATAVVVALLVGVAAQDQDEPGALVGALIGTASGLAFLFAFSPPPALRFSWRRPEQARVQEAVGDLMTASSEREVVERVLPPMGEIVGARGIALENDRGERIGAHGTVPDDAAGATTFTYPFGRFLVWTSPFAPYFGDEERKLLRTIGALTGLALDRARLFAQEREARETLERADELKNQFVALAAHELRSPVGAIYGLSETLAVRRGSLAPGQQEELEDTLRSQIQRLRELVEQLLDLSRLDADAVTINPTRVRVRERLEEIVQSVTPLSDAVGVDADPALEAEVDVDALDRIVSNLVVNACRYGEPPVRVSATSVGGRLQVVVEDRGPGVPAEFVPLLFERFARSDGSAATAVGTGLGLAIAQSYARAHRGDVSYEPAAPRGAAFVLTLPAADAA